MKYIQQFQQYLTRHFSFFTVITAFSAASVAALLVTPEGQHFTALSMTTWALCFLACFLLCLLLPTEWTPLPAIAGTFLYFQLGFASYQNSTWYLAGCVLLIGLLIWYGLGMLPPLPPIKGKLGKGLTISSVTLCAIVAALLISIVGVYRYLVYWAPCFDFGIFTQMFESMRTTLLPTTTCERNELLSHFAVHISPIYYLILPFYALFPRPETLAIAQGVIVGSAVIPLALICKQKGLTALQTALCTLCLAFYPALHGGTYYDIHENCFLAPLLLWFFYFMEKRSKLTSSIGMLVFALLTFAVKEDAAVYIAFIAVYLILSKRRPKFGVLLLVLSVAYLLFAVWILNQYGDGAMSWRYDNYLQEGQDSLVWVVINAFRNPAYTFAQCFTAEKVEYLLGIFAPIGGGIIIFSTKRPSRLILLGPLVLIALMPNYVYQHSLYFQYNFGIIAFLFYLVAVNLSECVGRTKRFIALFLAVTSMMGFSCLCASRLSVVQTYKDYQATYEVYNEVLEEVDRDRSVAASTFLVPHLYDCKELYEISRSSTTEQLVIMIAYEDGQQLMNHYLNNGYTVRVERDGLIAILEKNEQN